jgi:hypothetical protein
MNNETTALGQLLRDKLNKEVKSYEHDNDLDSKPVAPSIPEYTMHRMFTITKNSGGDTRFVKDAKWLASELQEEDMEVSTIYVRQGKSQQQKVVFCVQHFSENLSMYVQSYFFDLNDAVDIYQLYERGGKDCYNDISINSSNVY